MASSRRHLAVSFITRFIVCVLVLAAGVMVAGELIRTRSAPETVADTGELLRIQVLRIVNESVAERFTGYGTLQAVSSADISARVTAVVESVPEAVRDGAAIGKSEVIAVLDTDDYVEQLEVGQAKLAAAVSEAARLDVEERLAIDRIRLAERDTQLAKADLDRAREASSGGAVTAREVDAIEQRWLQAQHAVIVQREVIERLPLLRQDLEQRQRVDQAAVRLAKLNLERCTITSPISGVLGSVGIEVGEMVMAGQPIARVVDPARLKLPLHIAASARSHIAAGDQILISRPASDTSIVTGIARISPSDDPATRTMTVYAEVDGQGSALAPGLFVRGEVTSSLRTMRTIVPRRAVRNQHLMLIEEGRIAMRKVVSAFTIREARPETGVPDLEWVVLETLLPEGALLVVDGSRSLAEGTLVEAAIQTLEEEGGSNK